MFFLVSGAAASGKSTVVKGLPARLDGLICHDCDERRVEDEYTRSAQLEEWAQLALAHQEKGQDFLLATHSPLGELLACPSARKLAGISACVLDCSDPLRVQRMRLRGIDPRWPPDQDALNWAAWQRMHAWDPQWEQTRHCGQRPGGAFLPVLAKLAAGRPTLAGAGDRHHAARPRGNAGNGRRLGEIGAREGLISHAGPRVVGIGAQRVKPVNGAHKSGLSQSWGLGPGG